MPELPSQQLSPRAIYELLSEANVASAAALARASALADSHRVRSGGQRLIGVAMNLGGWMLRLKSGHTRQHPFFDDALFGIRMRAGTGDADLLILTGVSSQVSGAPTHYLDICRRHGAEGIIVGAFIPEEPELVELVASGFPCVAIDTQLIGSRASFVRSDNIGGAAAAVRHLAELGSRRIAYVGGWGPEPAHIDRRLGYESALGELGLETRDEYVLLGGWLHERAHDLVARALELPEPPDAFFCASDVMAIGAMTAIEEAGLAIPGDVAVLGFDDSEYASMVEPSLTSVSQDRIGLGAASVEAMLRILDNPDQQPPTTVLPTELIVRESTAGSAPGAEQETAIDAHGQARERIRVAGERLGSSSRLPAETLFHLLGKIDEPAPLLPASASAFRDVQEWDPEKRRLVGLAIDTAPDQSFRHAFFDELLYEIRAGAYARGVDLLVFTGVGTVPGAPFPPFLELCDRHRVDGLVVVSLPLEEPPVAAIASSDYPCVTLDVDLLSDRIAFVMSDNVGGGVKVTRHLIEGGRRRIAFIGGRGDERPSVDRRFGYQSELARWSLPGPEEYVAMANWLPDRAYQATRSFLALPEPPDAIFCASDVMAIGAMAAVEDAGLRVPEDVAVAGFDDVDYARLVTPSLTTVRQDQSALADGLIEAMLQLLEHPERPPTVSVIPVELVVRESSATG